MSNQNDFLDRAENIIQDCEEQIKELEEIVSISEREKDNNQTNNK